MVQPNASKWAQTSDPIKPEDPVTKSLFIGQVRWC